MNPILPILTQQYDDEMYSLLPRIEIPDIVLSSTLDCESESTSSIDEGEPSLKHAHNHDTDHDAKITTTAKKLQHNHDCVHSDTNIKHAHVENDKTMTNNSNSSEAEIGSALRSMTTATTAQDNTNNAKERLFTREEWPRRYEELIAFKQQYGHCNVARNYAQNKALGRWVHKQKTYYKLLRQGKPSHMTAERQAALENIGFEWALNNTSPWQTRYEELIAFKKQYGHCNVARNYAQNKALGGWVHKQKTYYKLLRQGKPSHMTAERQAALENIGFEWALNNTSSWQTRYDELIAFKKQYGHCNVARSYAQKKSLNAWITTQRKCYKLLRQGKPSSMTADRIAALEKIGFEWNRYKLHLSEIDINCSMLK